MLKVTSMRWKQWLRLDELGGGLHIKLTYLTELRS